MYIFIIIYIYSIVKLFFAFLILHSGCHCPFHSSKQICHTVHHIPHMVKGSMTIQVHGNLHLTMSQNIAERFHRCLHDMCAVPIGKIVVPFRLTLFDSLQGTADFHCLLLKVNVRPFESTKFSDAKPSGKVKLPCPDDAFQ